MAERKEDPNWFQKEMERAQERIDAMVDVGEFYEVWEWRKGQRSWAGDGWDDDERVGRGHRFESADQMYEWLKDYQPSGTNYFKATRVVVKEEMVPRRQNFYYKMPLTR